MADEAQQYSYTVEPFLVALESGKTRVTAHTVGDLPESPIDLRFIFAQSGDNVSEPEITV